MYELDGKYFSDAVYRKFGENVVVPGVGLTVVYPLNDYVRAVGRNLTPAAPDRLTPEPTDADLQQYDLFAEAGDVPKRPPVS